jgi:hypothetical protein
MGTHKQRITAFILGACLGLVLSTGCSNYGREAQPAVDAEGPRLSLAAEEEGRRLGERVSFLSRVESHCTKLTVLDRPQPFDAYFTWLAYDNQGRDGLGNAEGALYVWNGDAVGRGEKGFAEILRRVSTLPIGSRLLIYPYFLNPPTGPAMSRSSDDLFGLPFNLWDSELAEIVVKRNLKVILSPFDHTGRVHPQLAGFWHFRWTGCKNCDAWITWANYDGLGNPEEAMYIWNGREVGKGLEGFVEILSRLDQMKAESKVAVFPYYRRGRPKEQPERNLPFEEYYGLFDEVVYRRNLIVLLSEDTNAVSGKMKNAPATKTGKPER